MSPPDMQWQTDDGNEKAWKRYHWRSYDRVDAVASGMANRVI